MKAKYILLLAIAFAMFIACTKDNYDAPGTFLEGKLSYNGKTVPWNGNTETSEQAEIIHLYQDGFGKYAPIHVRVADDGTFKALLFDGEYKMIMKNIKYPFIFDDWPVQQDGKLDTVYFDLKGRKQMDINVIPYFDIQDIESKVNGTKVTTTFNIDPILPCSNVKAAYVYMHTTVNVNRGTQLNGKLENIDITQPVSMNIPISSYRSRYVNNSREYAYIRIALELDNADEYLWSEVIKVENIPLELNDVTKDYMKNTGPGIERIASDTRPGDILSTPADWTVNDAIKVFEGYGGLEMRWGRNAIGAAQFDAGDLKNGKIYQTFTLPAGEYEYALGFGGHNETWNGRENEAFMVVAKGNELPNVENLNTALVHADFNGFKQSSVGFTLAEETTISLGFVFNIIGGTDGRPGVAYFVPSVHLIAIE